MIYITHKILVLFQIIRILKRFLRSIKYITKSPRLEEYKTMEENLIKDARYRFRLNKLEKETNHAAVKGIRNLFRLKKENKASKDRIIRDIRNFSEHEEENNYKPVRVGNFWGNNYIEYKSKGNRKTLSTEEYHNKIKSYLKDIINDIKNSDIWKIQLITTINFISSKDDNDEKSAINVFKM